MARNLPEYPWDAMQPYLEIAQQSPGGVIDLSVGSPVDDPSPEVIAALGSGDRLNSYPPTVGTATLRAAIAAWFKDRRGVDLAPEQVLPTVGSKELVALLPFFLGLGPADAVVHPEIAYPSYEMGAALVGAEAVPADDPARWPANTKLVWINSPANPHGRVLDVPELKAAVDRARELGAVIVGDECYAEFGWEKPWDTTLIPSILDPRVSGDGAGVLCAYSLSKQSNLAGMRAAFVAGDQKLIAELTKIRKHAGLMAPAAVQDATIVALADHETVRQQRERYAARRKVLLPALQSAGWEISHSEAGLYLWATKGTDCWQAIGELAQLGIIAGPGEFYGQAGKAHVRFALTATDAAIADAAARIKS